ncbi:MAG: ABC transporter ATP-binding protein [Candidatus Aminicenantes bacterium]|nr:ABC transporter ATP-binding protein [Candidatus Aminicenantes bacterium]
MIKIENICYGINNKEILSDIATTLEKGDFCLVFGPNGAGKTTLLKILSGLITEFSGSVFIRGKDLKELSRKEMAKILSYQPQFEEFSLPISIKEILLSGRYPYKSFFKDYSKEDFRVYKNVVRQFNLKDFINRNINTLSGGERKKVMLASAIIQDVSIILYDEPFTFLDPEAVSNLKKMMLKLQKEGKTQVVVSHNFETLFPMVNKIMAIKHGRVVYSGEKKFDKEMLKTTYNTPFERVTFKEKEIIFPYE